MPDIDSSDARRFSMKELIMGGGIVSAVIIFAIWAITAGPAYLRGSLPVWLSSGEKILAAAVQEAEKVFPGVSETIVRVMPEVTGKVKELIPEMNLPEKDIAGEDIRPVPRHVNMVRVSFSIKNDKRTATYQGKTKLGAASNFYRKEMASLGFQEKILGASEKQEIYQYTKGGQVLEFTYKNVSAIRSEITELTIKEL
jgi:hypothetical protein